MSALRDLDRREHPEAWGIVDKLSADCNTLKALCAAALARAEAAEYQVVCLGRDLNAVEAERDRAVEKIDRMRAAAHRAIEANPGAWGYAAARACREQDGEPCWCGCHSGAHLMGNPCSGKKP